MAAATITKSSTAPAGDVSLSAGQITFTLNDKSTTYSTEDQSIISAALGSTTFDVKLPPPTVEEGTDTQSDPNDPRLHREADHLSAVASQETIDAADKNQQAIDDVTVVKPETSPPPTVEQALEQQFVATGTDVGPDVPFAETAAPTPSAPAADTAGFSSSAPADSTSTGASS